MRSNRLRAWCARSKLAYAALAVVTIASAGASSDPVGDEDGPWSTTMGSLTVGSGSETVTFTDLRSTCSALRLTLGLGVAAAPVRQCLPGNESRHVQLLIEGGAIAASTVDPDDEAGRCLVKALAGAHLAGLTCKLEASVAR